MLLTFLFNCFQIYHLAIDRLEKTMKNSNLFEDMPSCLALYTDSQPLLEQTHPMSLLPASPATPKTDSIC